MIKSHKWEVSVCVLKILSTMEMSVCFGINLRAFESPLLMPCHSIQHMETQLYVLTKTPHRVRNPKMKDNR